MKPGGEIGMTLGLMARSSFFFFFFFLSSALTSRAMTNGLLPSVRMSFFHFPRYSLPVCIYTVRLGG